MLSPADFQQIVLVCSEVERQGILFFSFKILFSVLGDEPQFLMVSWFSLLIVSLSESLEDAIGKQTVCGGWYSVTLFAYHLHALPPMHRF